MVSHVPLAKPSSRKFGQAPEPKLCAMHREDTMTIGDSAFYNLRKRHQSEFEIALRILTNAVEEQDDFAMVSALQKVTLALHHQLADEAKQALVDGHKAVMASVTTTYSILAVAMSLRRGNTPQVDLQAALKAAVEAKK